VPHAIKLQEKLSDQGLHVLLVEVQGHKKDEIVPFMAQAWSGKVPMGVLGDNSPFNLPGDSIPKTGLIGVDGTLVWTGNGGAGCEKILDEQLQKLHQIRAFDPALKGITKDLNARNFGKAVTSARAIVEKPPTPKAKEDAQALVDHLTKTVDARFAAAKRLSDRGRIANAKAQLQKLAKQTAGDKDWSAKVAEALKGYDDASLKDDLAADKMVIEAESMGTERKGRDGAALKLGEMLKKYPNAKVAKYAQELKGAFESKSALR
jgi:hypothetical protein